MWTIMHLQCRDGNIGAGESGISAPKCSLTASNVAWGEMVYHTTGATTTTTTTTTTATTATITTTW